MARLRPWLQTGIFVLAVVFLGALIATQWQQLQAYPWQIEIGWLLLALALLWLTWLLELNQWRFILGRLGGSLRFGEAARIWFLSNIGRYLPGKVWQIGAMGVMAQEQGVSVVAATGSADSSTLPRERWARMPCSVRKKVWS